MQRIALPPLIPHSALKNPSADSRGRMNAVPPQFIKGCAFDLIGSVTGATRRSLLKACSVRGSQKVFTLFPPAVCTNHRFSARFRKATLFCSNAFLKKVNTVNLFKPICLVYSAIGHLSRQNLKYFCLFHTK